MAEKRIVHTEAYATKDTFWNRERIKRGITYQQIADRYKVTPTSVCKWFTGRSLPRKEDTIWDLCEWFTDTPYTDGSCCIITHERGLYELEKAHEIYEAEFDKKKVLRADPKIDIVDAKINSEGFSATNFLNNLLKNRRLTQMKLGLEIDISPNVIRRFIHGVCMPSDEQIIKMANVLEYDPDKLTTIFKHAYDAKHEVEGQRTIEDIVTNEPDEEANKWADDVMSRIRNHRDQTDPEIEDAIKKMMADRNEVENALAEGEDLLKKMADHHDDHERFVKWFNFLSSISPARISDKDVVNIMTEYVNCNYCMYEAMEAWHNEYHPNYVHERYILLICDRKRWFGEDYETGTWLIEGL